MEQKRVADAAALRQALAQCEERLQCVIRLSADTYWEHDEHYRMHTLIGPAMEVPQLDPGEFVDKPIWELPGLYASDEHWRRYRELIESREPFHDLLTQAYIEGELQHYSNSGLPMFDRRGRFCGYRGIAKNVTRELRADHLLRLQHDISAALAEAEDIDRGVRAVLEQIGAAERWQCGAFWCVDHETNALRLQCHWMAPDATAPGADCFSHLGDTRVPRGVGMTGEVWKSGAPMWIQDINQRARPRDAGQMRALGFRSALVFPLKVADAIAGVFIFFSAEERKRDQRLLDAIGGITHQLDQFWRRRRAEQSLRENQQRTEYLATHDNLTGLPNRAMFNETLALALQNAQRNNRNFAVLFIDLDRFKNINDSFGHEAGDQLLLEVGRRLSHALRSSDVVARLGGDEFVVLVQEVGQPQLVAAVARKLLDALSRPVTLLGQECQVTASIGIAIYPTDAPAAPELMKNADIAMYRAKEEGKNNFQFYSENIEVQSAQRFALENNLRRALERSELLLHYQAKLQLSSNRITGVEALLRWSHPEQGMISPAQFSPLAEETGLIVPIGKWVLQTACAQNVAWQRAGLPPVCVAVNLSPRQFADEMLLDDIAQALSASGLRPDLLELELTESMVMQNHARAVKMLAAIKEMGVRIAIDDFGVGYSSLAQIKRFPIDTLKVDRSFIRELPDNPEDRAITKAIIALGKTLSLTVVAEGVETAAQEAFLREHACDETQGFYFSRPVPIDQFADLLRSQDSLGGAMR